MDLDFYTNVILYKNDILVKGYHQGNSVKYKVSDYKPTLYVKSKNKTEYTSLVGTGSRKKEIIYLEPVNFDSVSSASLFKKNQGKKVFGDIAFNRMWISDFFKGHINYDFGLIRIFTIDIECFVGDKFPDAELAEQEINLITVFDSKTSKFYTWGCKPYEPTLNNVEYTLCLNEKQLLGKFAQFWHSNFPDIINGWNNRVYDIKYIVNRMFKVLGENLTKKALSPWGIIEKKNIRIKGMSFEYYDIYGCNILDEMEMFKVFTQGGQESWTLDYISKTTIGEGKIPHTEFSSFDEFYHKDFKKFVDYNIHDVNLVLKIEKVMKFIDIAIDVFYISKLDNYSNTYGPVKLFETLIFNNLKEKNIFFSFFKDITKKTEKFEGAFVLEPKKGKHEWVVSLDAASLYPNVSIACNISPETLVKDIPEELQNITFDEILNNKIDLSPLKKYDLTMAPNGAFFRKDEEGLFPKIYRDFLEGRSKAKTEKIRLEKENQEILKNLKELGVTIDDSKT